MLKISEEDQGEIGNFTTELNSISEKIDEALAEVQGKIDDLNEHIQQYNNVLKNARDHRDGLVQQMRDYHASKSEKWQEGDEGDAYSSWMDEWENADLEFLGLADKVEIQDYEHAPAVLDELPTEP